MKSEAIFSFCIVRGENMQMKTKTIQTTEKKNKQEREAKEKTTTKKYVMTIAPFGGYNATSRTSPKIGNNRK